MEKSESIKELLDLKSAYEQEKLKLSATKETLLLHKKEIYNQIVENIKSEIDSTPNNARLQKYLETTYTKKFDFLFRSINFMSGNNQKGNLSFHELLLLDEEVKKISIEYGISSKDELWKIFCDYSFYHKEHPFLKNEKVIEVMGKVPTLAYLDELFKNIDNVLAYQGSYTAYQYVKRRLKEVLIEESTLSDNDLIFKDYHQKLELVLTNLSTIASYLLSIREQIPDSRLAICNQGLSRTAKKVAGTGITFDQKVFANGIAFGTTLEKLQDGNYEDAKSLIYIPHQRLLK